MSCAIELVTGPLSVYIAATGEAFPAVAAAPAGNWVLIGGSLGARRYSEDGISILQDVETSDVNSLGSIDPECVLMTGRNLRVTLMMKNLHLDQLRYAFQSNAVTANAADDELDLNVGPDLTVSSILIRGTSKSPQESGFNMQFEFENCIELASKEINFNKEDAAEVALEFRVLAGDQVFRTGHS